MGVPMSVPTPHRDCDYVRSNFWDYFMNTPTEICDCHKDHKCPRGEPSMPPLWEFMELDLNWPNYASCLPLPPVPTIEVRDTWTEPRDDWYLPTWVLYTLLWHGRSRRVEPSTHTPAVPGDPGPRGPSFIRPADHARRQLVHLAPQTTTVSHPRIVMSLQPGVNEAAVKAQFAQFYLERTTQELAEDLDRVRNADDFKADSVAFLVHALRQGAAQFSVHGQQRTVSDASKPAAGPGDAS
ncbi:ribosome assembly protein 3 [Purpureocillium lilacinum]|uniref:Ribosome assembly protein 3 n=1 Tax=Purpureocillium lilacinum TaxID=33203 RepID=A0A2U3END6_PURLI|nr:ribosome assembly protein 3 [Purpureocillium lilacinum]